MNTRLGYLILYVDSVPEVMDFYEQAFGLTRRFLHESEDYGEMETGATTLSFTSHALGSEAVPIAYRKTSPSEQPPGFELSLVSDDVDALWSRAIESGAEGLSEPHDEPWGQRVAYVRDCEGNLVGIVSPMGGS
jgi:uncharacterized glyoxalase superfamily protein PhnB